MTTCVCPACGFHGSLVVFANDVDARHVAALMGRVPPDLAEAINRYLGMFAPAKHKLTWARARRVLEELVPDLERGAIERRRLQTLIPTKTWLQGLERMHTQRATLDLPLRNHGYLYDVLASLVKREESEAERAVEESRRNGRRGSAPAAAGQVLDQAAAEAMREAHVRTVCGSITNDIKDDRKWKRPERSLTDIAKGYREQFGDVVVDTAIQRLSKTN